MDEDGSATAHGLLAIAETAAGYVYECECGAKGTADPDRQFSLDAYLAHVAQQS